VLPVEVREQGVEGILELWLHLHSFIPSFFLVPEKASNEEVGSCFMAILVVGAVFWGRGMVEALKVLWMI